LSASLPRLCEESEGNAALLDVLLELPARLGLDRVPMPPCLAGAFTAFALYPLPLPSMA
jgi:hypothetical protein